jgi:hypothetical protein
MFLGSGLNLQHKSEPPLELLLLLLLEEEELEAETDMDTTLLELLLDELLLLNEEVSTFFVCTAVTRRWNAAVLTDCTIWVVVCLVHWLWNTTAVDMD